MTLTHDPKLDDPAIAAALRGAGLLRRLPRLAADPRQARRAADARRASATAEIARIHAPVGADIGAQVAGRDRDRHPRRDHRAAAPAGDAALSRCASDPSRSPRPRARSSRIRWPPAALRLKKGRLLAAADVAALAAAGVAEVTVARLEAGRHRARTPRPRRSRRLCATGRRRYGLSRSAPFTGRVNVFAEADGLLRVDARGGRGAQRASIRRSRSRPCPTGRGSGRGRWSRR